MHRNNLNVRNFELSRLSLIGLMMVVLLAGTTGIGVAADKDTATAGAEKIAVDSPGDTVDVTDSAQAISDQGPEQDNEYIFSEEYEAVDDNEAETEPVDSISDTTIVSGKTTAAGKMGKQVLAIIGFFQRKIVNNLRFFDGPVVVLKKHAAKLLLLGISLMIILLTITFYRERLEKGRFMTTTRLSVMDKEVQRACRYIEEHFDDPELGTEPICKALVTGEAFLEALFVKELGLTVDDFISQVRINRAKILLRNDPSITREALVAAIGFTDEHRFDERFDTITGLSLETYRTHLSKSTDASS